MYWFSSNLFWLNLEYIAKQCFVISEFASSEDEANFVKEMRLRKHVGRHPCIVSMLACSTKPPGVCIIMDYCDKGDLKSYLRDIREEMLSHERQLELSQDYKHSETQGK